MPHLLIGAVVLGLLLVDGGGRALLVQQSVQRHTGIVRAENLRIINA